MTYSPYGYGPYPGYYYNSPSQGYAMPQGTTVPPGATYPTPSLGPGSSSPQTWSPSPTPATPGGSSGPSTFSNPSLNGAKKPADSLVPEPRPVPGSNGSAQPNEQNSTPFGTDNSRPAFGNVAQTTPSPANGGPVQSVSAIGADGNFQAPINRAQSPDAATQAPGTSPPGANGVNPAAPYAYDRTAYSWLRGTVDYDPGSKTWQIIYGVNPDPSDPYGGAFCLVDSPKLNGLHDGDVVYVEGQLNRQLPGKPRYEINNSDGGIVQIAPAQSPSVAN